MRIGIVTLFGLYNYGNRLQNLAVTELFKRQNYEVETIVCEKFRLRTILKKIYYKILFWTVDGKRNLSFERFNSKYIKINHIYRRNPIIPNSISDSYNLFVVGSDQVWNPELRKNEKDNFYLKFAPSYKRVCISPSIGISKVRKEDEQGIKDGLEGFRYLCCREEQGAREIARITGRSVETLIDPTLALDAKYWSSIADYSDIPMQKYILNIFLGGINKVVKERIETFAESQKCEIINIFDKSSHFYISGPETFISLIDKAEIVFTDSFHAVAFSINMNTPFYAFNRIQSSSQGNMNSRIRSLLKICSMENRFIDADFDYYNLDCDFTTSNIQLAKERDKFKSFVLKALTSIK